MTASSSPSSVTRSTTSGRSANREYELTGTARVSSVTELTDFGLIVLLVAGTFSLAIAAYKVTELFPIPAPALFLVIAAVASDIWPGLDRLSTVDVERIAAVALIAILFDGGMQVGWHRFRAAALPITALGLLGTFATAGLIALAAHWLFDFGWITAGILGAALAPTDPAVMFSVLGRREIGGRTGTILEGESGANDPVGIALMIGMLEYATHDDASFWTVVREFAIEMSVGLAIGVAGALVLVPAAAAGRAPERGALSDPHARDRRRDLRRRVRRARLGLPGRVHRGARGRLGSRAVQGRDRALPHLARQPGGDHRLRRTRAHHPPRRPAGPLRVGRRAAARPDPRVRRPAARCRRPAPPREARPRRAGLHPLGRAEGCRADPPRRVRA